jgi:predicted Zn-dependent protease
MSNPSRYVEFTLEDGGSILIETPDQQEKAQSGFVKGAQSEREVAVQAGRSFDASVENVRRAAELLVSKLRAISTPPDEMSVSFGLKASGDLGSLAIGKVGAEANYAVTLKWRKEDKKADEPKAGDKKEEPVAKKEEEEHKD